MSTGDDDRPTLVPPFDVAQYARDAAASPSDRPEMPTVVPPPTVDPARAPMSTLTDDAETEAARMASLHPSSSAPPSAPSVEVVWTQSDDDFYAPPDPVEEARARMARGDFAGAMTLIEPVVRKDFGNAKARAIVERCERELMTLYTERIGSLRRVPRILLRPQDLSRLALDHRAGFLIALVDGVSSIETILDMSGMPAFETLRTLIDLEASKVLTFEG